MRQSASMRRLWVWRPESSSRDGCGAFHMGRPAMSAKIAAMSDRGDEPAASRARRGAVGTAAASEQERRYLTVVFCDLVDSTVLAGDLDPEDLEELYAASNGTVRRAIEAFCGFITRTIGDGGVAV